MKAESFLNHLFTANEAPRIPAPFVDAAEVTPRTAAQMQPSSAYHFASPYTLDS
jgi:hypothetical protein